MTAESIGITHQGYTDTQYTSCGDYGCTLAILRAVGASEKDAADYEKVDIELGDDTQVSVAILGESDSCEFCAACGDFIRHGIRYREGGIGCTCEMDEWDNVIDPNPLESPHINLRDHPAMADYR